MSVVKSFSVGNGDMFYVNHNSDNFTIIDCCLPEDAAGLIIAEVKAKQKTKGALLNFEWVKQHGG